jgi:hypothetical protein
MESLLATDKVRETPEYVSKLLPIRWAGVAIRIGKNYGYQRNPYL